MPCEHMGVLLSRYVDGEASAEDRRVVDGHVRECAECRKELEVFSRNEALLGKAFSEEVAGEAFIADVLAKAGLVPSRPGPLRRRLTRAAAVIADFLAVPARAAATVLVALSALLAWNSHAVHQQNQGLIEDINIALRQIQESNREKGELVDILRRMKSTIEQAAAKPANPPPDDVARDPESAPLPAVVVNDPPRAEQPEPKHELKALLPTDFFHSVSAFSSVEGVFLRWETKTPSGKVAFDVFRQDLPGSEFHGPLNKSPILRQFAYLDEGARPASTYAYQIVAVPETGEPEKSRAIEIHTLGDIRIQNNGVMSTGAVSRSLIDVQRYVDGRWVSSIFQVAEGQPIGGPQYCKETKGEVDFTTGCVLRGITEEEREVRRLVSVAALDAEGNPLLNPETGSFYYIWREVIDMVTTNRIGVTDKAGKEYKLWKGEGRRGTLGSLE